MNEHAGSGDQYSRSIKAFDEAWRENIREGVASHAIEAKYIDESNAVRVLTVVRVLTAVCVVSASTLVWRGKYNYPTGPKSDRGGRHSRAASRGSRARDRSH